MRSLMSFCSPMLCVKSCSLLPNVWHAHQNTFHKFMKCSRQLMSWLKSCRIAVIDRHNQQTFYIHEAFLTSAIYLFRARKSSVRYLCQLGNWENGRGPIFLIIIHWLFWCIAPPHLNPGLSHGFLVLSRRHESLPVSQTWQSRFSEDEKSFWVHWKCQPFFSNKKYFQITFWALKCYSKFFCKFT